MIRYILIYSSDSFCKNIVIILFSVVVIFLYIKKEYIKDTIFKNINVYKTYFVKIICPLFNKLRQYNIPFDNATNKNIPS